MSMNKAAVAANLVRTELWSSELKEILLDNLAAQAHVRWFSDFPDGTTLTIPSIGEGTVRDFVDDTSVVYDALDTGEFGFTITEYKQSGTYITRQAQQDSFYSAQLEGSFVPKQNRALMENLETDILLQASGQSTAVQQSGGQTVSNPNTINGADHRLIASGTDVGTGDNPMAIKDFAKALHSLKKANVPGQNLIAIVDPSVEYTINTLTNIIGGSSVPADEAFAFKIASGVGTDMRFVQNIFGFDVYVSNYLAGAGATGAGAETITDVNGTADTIAAGVNNIFFSAADQSILPFIGAWRQLPIVDSEFNKDKQRTEYLTTARYGLKLYRPENLVTVLSSTAVVV